MDLTSKYFDWLRPSNTSITYHINFMILNSFKWLSSVGPLTATCLSYHVSHETKSLTKKMTFQNYYERLRGFQFNVPSEKNLYGGCLIIYLLQTQA